MYKMDLAIITYDGWYAIKTQPNQPKQNSPTLCKLESRLGYFSLPEQPVKELKNFCIHFA